MNADMDDRLVWIPKEVLKKWKENLTPFMFDTDSDGDEWVCEVLDQIEAYLK